MAEIIPYRFYEDPKGVRYSLFTAWKPADAALVERGFTIRWPDGTYGCGRKPFASVAEAEAYLAKVPKNFPGMSVMSS